MMEALHREHKMSDMFVAYLLARNIRYEEDLVDQLFNSSEKRLARILLITRSLRQGRRAADGGPRDKSSHAGGDGGHNPLAGEFFHEPLPETGIYPLQRRWAAGPQFTSERGSSRLTGKASTTKARTFCQVFLLCT